MGLDQYLMIEQTYSDIVTERGPLNEPGHYSAIVDLAFSDLPIAHGPGAGGFGMATASVKAVQWRKDYEVHAWFVDNVQDGQNDCGSYVVHRDDLERLRADVTAALAVHEGTTKKTTKPPADNPFLPGPVDEEDGTYYWQGLRFTQTAIAGVLTWLDHDQSPYTVVTYQSSF